MTFSDTLTIYAVTPENYGDPQTGTSYETDCVADLTQTWSHSGFADLDPGSVTAWISPDSEAWSTYGPGLVGGLADYNDVRYRIQGAHPTGSLLTGEPDVVELALVRASDVG